MLADDIDAAGAPPPLPPRSVRAPVVPRRTGVENVNIAVNDPRRLGNLITPGMRSWYRNGIDTTDALTVSDLRDAYANTHPELNRDDLLRSGFTQGEMRHLQDGVRVPDSDYARRQLREAANHFNRYLNTQSMDSFHASQDALRYARDGMQTHFLLGPTARPS
jgi:hypothetical protein